MGHGEGRDAKDHPVSFHRAQLEMLGVPPNLWEQLEKVGAAPGAQREQVMAGHVQARVPT